MPKIDDYDFARIVVDGVEPHRRPTPDPEALEQLHERGVEVEAMPTRGCSPLRPSRS